MMFTRVVVGEFFHFNFGKAFPHNVHSDIVILEMFGHLSSNEGKFNPKAYIDMLYTYVLPFLKKLFGHGPYMCDGQVLLSFGLIVVDFSV